MKLQISYFRDTDTLSFWNGQPAWSADDVAQNLTVDLHSSGSPVGMTLEHAAELLLPFLHMTAPAQEPKPGVSSKSGRSPAAFSDRREDNMLEIDYHAEADVIWLGNGQPTPVGDDIAENVTVFFDMEETQPNAVMIEHAAEILLPILQAAIQANEATKEGSVKPAKASWCANLPSSITK